ncbi:helix-turn-helix domain-containing protein [Azospirillum doebereinerae]|uniref:helix-turn-helix domain-containing protein n=1 Tax=Azospirillum doebereinerae TaxID=92933 RepID=UPI001EE5D9FF|nr:helix-turn-helix transcriptional regulator [Azospirillum doebereinerae]MCG5241385.1 helix-turn-helix domain-containing protein [Azospirillum doebereinerae]
MDGEAFKAELRYQALTQRQFGQLTGSHESTVSNWATGKAPIPDWVPAYLRAYAQVPELRRRRLFPPQK